MACTQPTIMYLAWEPAYQNSPGKKNLVLYLKTKKPLLYYLINLVLSLKILKHFVMFILQKNHFLLELTKIC